MLTLLLRRRHSADLIASTLEEFAQSLSVRVADVSCRIDQSVEEFEQELDFIFKPCVDQYLNEILQLCICQVANNVCGINQTLEEFTQVAANMSFNTGPIDQMIEEFTQEITTGYKTKQSIDQTMEEFSQSIAGVKVFMPGSIDQDLEEIFQAMIALVSYDPVTGAIDQDLEEFNQEVMNKTGGPIDQELDGFLQEITAHTTDINHIAQDMDEFEQLVNCSVFGKIIELRVLHSWQSGASDYINATTYRFGDLDFGVKHFAPCNIETEHE